MLEKEHRLCSTTEANHHSWATFMQLTDPNPLDDEKMNICMMECGGDLPDGGIEGCPLDPLAAVGAAHRRPAVQGVA